MDIYQVGGAVRDGLLGAQIKDRDWVVVGANSDALTALGYRQVGADFQNDMPTTGFIAQFETRKGAVAFGGNAQHRPNVVNVGV